MTALDYALKTLSENAGIIVALIAAYTAFKINDHKKIQDKKIEVYEEITNIIGELSETASTLSMITEEKSVNNIETKNFSIKKFRETFNKFRVQKARYQIYMHPYISKGLDLLVYKLELRTNYIDKNLSAKVGDEKSRLVQKAAYAEIWSFLFDFLERYERWMVLDIKNKNMTIKLLHFKFRSHLCFTKIKIRIKSYLKVQGHK